MYVYSFSLANDKNLKETEIEFFFYKLSKVICGRKVEEIIVEDIYLNIHRKIHLRSI